MTSKWKTILFIMGLAGSRARLWSRVGALALLLATAVTLTFLVRDQRATVALQPDSGQMAAGASQPQPEHHTVTVHCSASVTCTGGRVTIQTSDGGSSQQSFNMNGPATTSFTFSGLTGGGAALDLSNPQVYCLAGDSTTIPMGPGASASGAPLNSPFTVPAGIAATVTIACQ